MPKNISIHLQAAAVFEVLNSPAYPFPRQIVEGLEAALTTLYSLENMREVFASGEIQNSDEKTDVMAEDILDLLQLPKA